VVSFTAGRFTYVTKFPASYNMGREICFVANQIVRPVYPG